MNPTIRIDDEAGKRKPVFAERCLGFVQHPHRSPVSHDFAALSFYVGGSARLEQRGIWRLEAGDVFIVPAGQSHRLVEATRPDVWRLGLCVTCLAAQAPAMLEPFERVRDGASPVVRIPAGRRAFLRKLFAELGANVEQTTTRTVVRDSLLTLILSEVMSAAQWTGHAAPERSVVVDSLRFIERHCLEPLTLTRIAAAVHRTPSYVTTALTRTTGRSAVAWIIAGRLAEARRWLLHSDESVDAVAERVGYEDSTHFIRLFRRAHGVTPAAWRALQRRANSSRQSTAGRELQGERVIQHRGGLHASRGR